MPSASYTSQDNVEHGQVCGQDLNLTMGPHEEMVVAVALRKNSLDVSVKDVPWQIAPGYASQHRAAGKPIFRHSAGSNILTC